jgi:hypothetical protein
VGSDPTEGSNVTTSPETGLKASALDMLTGDEANRVAALVMRDNEGVNDQALALSIVDEALKFLAASGKNTGNGKALRPSRVVDMGWHALILHTEIYFKVCGQWGRYIHHRPEGPETLRRVATTLDDTTAAITAAGYTPNEYLWGDKAETEVKGGDCMHTECSDDNGRACTSPQIFGAVQTGTLDDSVS